jgi:hypothetical protein
MIDRPSLLACRSRLVPGRHALAAAVVWLFGLSGCASPEDSRQRGGGVGGDGGNYRGKPVSVPSKIEGTRGPSLPAGAP